jgi:hypothetical protein
METTPSKITLQRPPTQTHLTYVIKETDTGRHTDLLLVDSRYNIERERASDARLGGLTRYGGRSNWVGHDR